VAAGGFVGITAGGQISVSPTHSVGPGGDPSCTPAQNYPGKAGRPVAMKAAAVRENVRPSERASVVGSPSMGLAG
jgi:hypothetical protein